MCPFPPPEPPQPPNRIRQRSNSPSACQKVIRRQPNSGGSSQFQDRKSTRLNSSHGYISYAVFGLKKKTYRSPPAPVHSPPPAPPAERSALRHSPAPSCDRTSPYRLVSRHQQATPRPFPLSPANP